MCVTKQLLIQDWVTNDTQAHLSPVPLILALLLLVTSINSYQM